MPAQPDGVTPTPLIDTVQGRIVVQFTNGAFLTVALDGTVEVLVEGLKPDPGEVALVAQALTDLGDTGRAEALARWAA